MTDPHNRKTELPIDYGDVLERIGGDLAFLDELLKIYFVEFQEKESQIETALRTSNFSMMQDLGHSLKGASANLSLSALQRCALGLELAGRERKLEQARQALTDLLTERRRLQDYLLENPPPR